MGNISIKDNELVSLLPKHLRESSELKSAAKLILGDLMFLNNREFAKENGFVFRTNQDLMKDTGIKGESTVIKALAKLEIEGFINRTSGKRGKASEYRLNMDKIKDKHTVTEIHSNNENSNLSVLVSNHSKTETDVMNSRLERIENLLSTKLDTMIEILNKINSNNNEIITQIKTIYTQINGINRNSNLSVSDSNLSTDKETESHKESSNNILHIDISSITSEEIDHLDNFLKKKIIKEKANYMKDNEISGPEVNVVANSENNGMNDNTKNNNIQPLQDQTSDTSDTSTVSLSGDDGIGGMVPSVEENNIQPVQVRTSDALDTPTVPLSGNEGIVSTHTTSEANTIPTVNGTETLQHPAYSSAKPSKKTPKDAAAAVGGGKKGGAGRNISTSAEQSPTTDEKVDNIAPLDMISAFDDSIERKLWGMLRKRKDVLIFRDFSDINGKERVGVSDKAKRIINLTDATLDYDFDGNDTFGMLFSNGNGKFRFFATDCNMLITTWDDGKKTDENPVPNGVF